MINLQPTFSANLQQLPSTVGVQRVDLFDQQGVVIACIENQPGKHGSVAVYQHLQQAFGILDARSAEYGLLLFAEHTADARNRPGAHPNIDRLIDIAAGQPSQAISIILEAF